MNASLGRGLRRLCSLPSTAMPFDAVQLDLGRLDPDQFAARLPAALASWREQGKSAVWLRAPESSPAGMVAQAAELGFRYHHAEPGSAMLSLWLGPGESKIPGYATHKVGCAGMVFNQQSELLVIRETRGVDGRPGGFGTGWKLPGGLADLGEGIGAAAAREVEEETGVLCEPVGLVGFREQHNTVWGRSDLYFICEMTLAGSPELTAAPGEIAEARWMPVDEFAASTDSQMNNLVARTVAARAGRPSCLHPTTLEVKPSGSRGGVLHMPGPQPALSAAQACAVLLRERRQTVALAESSSGGLAAGLLLEVPGASGFIGSSVVCYSKAAKQQLLGLSQAEQQTAASATPEHALVLARAARERLGADWGVGETGVAGPTPNSRGVPPGVSYVGVAGPGGVSATCRVGVDGLDHTRGEWMRTFAAGAIELLRDTISDDKQRDRQC